MLNNRIETPHPKMNINLSFNFLRLNARQIKWLWWTILLLSLVPALRLLVGLLLVLFDGRDALGANPTEFLTRYTGTWAINFLVLSLCCTPLRRWANLNWTIRMRRMLGLLCFFYATLHMLCYFWLDQQFQFDDIVRDIVKRPFVTVGFASFCCLLPLAATSFNRAMQLLGRNWSKLHRLVYLVALLVLAHYFWLSKGSALLYPWLYSVLIVSLLLSRLIKK